MPTCGNQLIKLCRFLPICNTFVLNGHYYPRCSTQTQVVLFSKKGKGRSKRDSSIFLPVSVLAENTSDDINVGAELVGQLSQREVVKILNQFYRHEAVRQLCLENDLDEYVLHESFVSFRKLCLESNPLPVDLHVTLSDLGAESGHLTDLFPFFLRHCRQVFPHLDCVEDLQKIGDLRRPPNWYPEARALTRKLIFHCGPTNSGKTYHALQRFLNAKSGVYCGPLKLLASEVYHKANQHGTVCDLITGEERRFGNGNESPANHVSCTVEMASLGTHYEVAVIDEIQMLRDPQRGWAWSRALLGLVAEEIHVCGEEATSELLEAIAITMGEEVEVRHYERLTPLEVENTALNSLENIQSGDCIVCFSKRDIFNVSQHLEKLGIEVAVIYGSLPPTTKLAMAHRFNDPKDPVKVLVATDAIGMGINLSIRRIIFYSMMKPILTEKGDTEMATISSSQAKQIAGRAGRYGTIHSTGFVSTLKSDDLHTLQTLLAVTEEPIKKAGLHPTADQIELYAYHLPNATLLNLIDIFMHLCRVDDSLYFMCNVDDFKFLADMIQDVPLPLRARYVFCCAPINRKVPFVCTMFLKFAKQYSRNEGVTLSWLCQQVGWPLHAPHTLNDLVHLEAVFDVFDLYLWLSYRFGDLFPEADRVRETQKELDTLIEDGVLKLTRLLANTEKEARITASTLLSSDSGYHKTRSKTQSKASNHFDEEVPQRGRGTHRDATKYVGAAARGKITERLLMQGLITPKMLQDMQREWKQQQNDDPEDTPRRPGGYNKGRKRSS